MILPGGFVTAVAAAAVFASGGCRGGGDPAPAPAAAGESTARTAASSDSGASRRPDTLFDQAIIAALPGAERDAWMRYLAISRAKREAERAAMDAELREAGQERMAKAPYMRRAFEVTSRMRGPWLQTDSARRLAENILSFQTPSGGWSKHVDFTQGPRKVGQSYFSESDGWSYIGTIDNGSTTSQMLFLAAAHAALPDDRYRDGFVRGLEYLLAAQFPNGCFPQVYPLQGGYHDAATFNDDAIVNVLKIFRDVGRGRYEFVPAEVRQRVAAGLALGVDCILDSQIVVDGRRVGWAQQHHPATLEPVQARSYELVGISGRETSGIVEFLMSLSKPEPKIVEAVHAAVDWLRATRIDDHSYDFETGLRAEPGAGPIWARLYEIGTNRPIFSNRDGVKLYDWNQLTDRRQGYGWFGSEPVAVLKKYDETWAQRYPRAPSSGAAKESRDMKSLTRALTARGRDGADTVYAEGFTDRSGSPS